MRCEKCQDRGWISAYQPPDPGDIDPCPDCGGAGQPSRGDQADESIVVEDQAVS